MRFATEDQGEVIHGIIAVVHEHLDIIQDAGVKMLGLVNCQEQWLPLFLIPVSDLFADGLEHGGFAAFFTDSKDGTQLLVKVSNTDGGKAQIFHVTEAGI